MSKHGTVLAWTTSCLFYGDPGLEALGHSKKKKKVEEDWTLKDYYVS